MIRFLRTLRQRLLAENRVSKYLLYAIGEIVLVMVGILLALQVNTWNEERKERALEQKVLLEIYRSIEKDTSSLNWEYQEFQNVLDAARLIVERLDSDAPYEARLDTAFALISNINVVEANYTAYDRLVSIGVDLVKNDSLRNGLVSFYDHSRFLKRVENYYENSKYYRTVIYPKYFKTFQYGREAKPLDFEALRKANDFRIALDYSINDALFYRRWSQHRKEDATDLLQELRTYLGNEIPQNPPKTNQP
ncbi:MAG TPA: DUF6090 family protein [Robiginitalea sp.]|nr:DUF6090 family protein [Robiginitalea sp.]